MFVGPLTLLIVYKNFSKTSSWNTRAFVEIGCKKIQDFKKNDTPKTMYTRLVRFVHKIGNALHNNNSIHFFVFKQDKKVQKLVFSKFLTKYGEKLAFLQAFMLVECIDNTICIEKASKLGLTMATKHSKPKMRHNAKHTHVQGSLAEMEVNMMLCC